MHNKVIYIAYTDLLPSDQNIAELIKRGNSIFMTSTSSKTREINAGPHLAYRCSANHDLARAANDVVECAEMFGGIDILLYAKWEDMSEELFLDVKNDEIENYLGQIRDFFTLCKCSVPYMLGRKDASILLPIDSDISTLNVLRAIYRGACISASEVLSKEFAEYGLTVKTIQTMNGPLDVIKTLL